MLGQHSLNSAITLLHEVTTTLKELWSPTHLLDGGVAFPLGTATPPTAGRAFRAEALATVTMVVVLEVQLLLGELVWSCGLRTGGTGAM